MLHGQRKERILTALRDLGIRGWAESYFAPSGLAPIAAKTQPDAALGLGYGYSGPLGLRRALWGKPARLFDERYR